MLAVFACPEVPADEPAAVPTPERSGSPTTTVTGGHSSRRAGASRRSRAMRAGRASRSIASSSRGSASAGSSLRPKRRRADLHPPADLRPHRPAADAGGGGRVPRRRRSPIAVERLVDRLLASPRFGERMASLWLPLARYAEDQAHQVGEDTKFFYPNAYRYREWVIDAFNRDLPYDEFVKLQLAADTLPAAAPDDLAALGFLGLGPKYYNRNRLEVMADEWEDRVDTVTRTLLGLTVACARCHDHKFDPITHARLLRAGRRLREHAAWSTRQPTARCEKEDAKADKMDPATLHIVEDGDVAGPERLHPRQRRAQGRRWSPRRFLAVLCRGEPAPFTDGSGRRELAEAIASRGQSADRARDREPRLGRVLRHAARGDAEQLRPLRRAADASRNCSTISPCASWTSGWSVKALVREIVLSATYRQSVRQRRGEAQPSIPANELLWRMNRRRLTVEQWRDAVLAVVGRTRRNRRREVAASSTIPTNRQRTVYARISRLKLNDLLMQFDYPDANVHAEKRSVTTTPMQKLFVLNSPFMQRQRRGAGGAAARRGAEDDDGARRARLPAALRARARRRRSARWRSNFLRAADRRPTCRAGSSTPRLLLASNEMLYVD